MCMCVYDALQWTGVPSCVHFPAFLPLITGLALDSLYHKLDQDEAIYEDE